MISITAEYALRAVVVLAKAKEPMKTKDVAEVSQVPREYLAKIVQLLAKGDIIDSKKGRGGGISLARDLKNISLFDVIRVVDPFRHYETCPFKIKEHKGGLCPLHHHLESMIQDTETAFKKTTLDTLVDLSESTSALCEVERKELLAQRTPPTRGRAPLSAHNS
jgi:Rrf2 family transcriptional regulator, nitric oxide-sensitive transcriptional repressor